MGVWSLGRLQSLGIRVTKFSTLDAGVEELAGIVLCVPGGERNEADFAAWTFVNFKTIAAPAGGGAVGFGRRFQKLIENQIETPFAFDDIVEATPAGDW